MYLEVEGAASPILLRQLRRILGQGQAVAIGITRSGGIRVEQQGWLVVACILALVVVHVESFCAGDGVVVAQHSRRASLRRPQERA